MNSTVIVFLILYFLVVLGIGVWAMRGGVQQRILGLVVRGGRGGAKRIHQAQLRRWYAAQALPLGGNWRRSPNRPACTPCWRE
ncbi:MAG: hypothetical protein E2O59_07330 [Gammaproteobacteria bacterium]|nr:MAG: hypothetical protein E2O59_07330 [Gammaproteobacteria bacterium]